MFEPGGKQVRVDATKIDEAGRKRAAVELVARHGEALKRTARRYSLCAEDAEDALQRALEILLTKAPTGRARDLYAWTTTVVKHEALSVRREREQLLGKTSRRGRDGEELDALARVASPTAGPFERLERHEEIVRSREALRALKPAERRALALLAEGYSYAEIGEITGYSKTKVNRCLAEGRERFRRIVASSEDGSRCAEMRVLLSAFCDRETSAAQSAKVHEHLRACGRCRAVVRAYRGVPATVAALCPLPVALATGGKGGGGLAAAKGGWVGGLGKLAGVKQALTICAVAGTAAGVAAGVVPLPDGAVERSVGPRIERVGPGVLEPLSPGGDRQSKARNEMNRSNAMSTRRAREASPLPPEPVEATAPAPVEPVEAAPVEAEPAPIESATPPPAEPVESAPPPAPPPAEAGGAAGEFGP